MSGRAFQTEGLQCPAPRLEHRVGWNKSKKTGSGDRPCRLVGHVLALAFSQGDGKSLGSENWSDLGCVLKACIYSSQGCMVGLS